MGKTLELASLTGSRLCHDLISPLGAIGNGLELMSWAGVPETPEFNLIRESFMSAQARISFFRIAFGPAKDGEEKSGSELMNTINAYVNTNRMTVDWSPNQTVPHPRAKLVFLLIMCLEHAMPYAGTITISADGTKLHARSDALSPVESSWNILKGASPDRAAEVQFAVAAEQAENMGVALSVKISPQQITIAA